MGAANGVPKMNANSEIEVLTGFTQNESAFYFTDKNDKVVTYINENGINATNIFITDKEYTKDENGNSVETVYNLALELSKLKDLSTGGGSISVSDNPPSNGNVWIDTSTGDELADLSNYITIEAFNTKVNELQTKVDQLTALTSTTVQIEFSNTVTTGQWSDSTNYSKITNCSYTIPQLPSGLSWANIDLISEDFNDFHNRDDCSFTSAWTGKTISKNG